MQCDWKHHWAGITTSEQAAEALFTLKQLAEIDTGVDARYDEKMLKLKQQREAERVLEFAGVADPVSFDVYSQMLVDRLTEYGLNRMEGKTFKCDGGQVSRRTTPDAVAPIDGGDQLKAVQAAISERIVTLLRAATLWDLAGEETRKKASKDETKRLKETSLAGLYRLKVEADTDSIKAKLKSGELKPEKLPQLGFEYSAGVEKAYVAVK